MNNVSTRVKRNNVDEARRRTLRRVCIALTGPLLTGCGPTESADRLFERIANALNEWDVERLYSTKPIRILGQREYVIPVNYFNAKGRDDPESRDFKNGFGFVLFLPDYGGFTKANWQDEFDRRKVTVMVRPVDKTAKLPTLDGGVRQIEPAGYGDPKARWQNGRLSLEATPSFIRFGLEGYRPANGTPGMTWAGTRSNGEFFFFDSSRAPDDETQREPNPQCDVRYYSEHEDLRIHYLYSQHHIAQWREIDDAIWSKLHEWRVS